MTFPLNPATTASAAPISVSGLTQQLRQCIEGQFGRVRVQGEVSGFSRPASGHWYYNLKDAGGQVRCAQFKGKTFGQSAPKDGDEVVVTALVTVYPARGELQLVVEKIESVGVGNLWQQFEARKAKLQSEGLFSQKRPLPATVQRVGLVSSEKAAALQDVLDTLRRRWPLLEVIFAPSLVQGNDAPAQIVHALQRLAQQPHDVLLLVRGGGSMEDLWCFNDESVVRAIHAHPVPVVTGVGHETDFTLADFAADLRAATPTAAAEQISPDQQSLLAALERWPSRSAPSLSARQQALKQWQQRLHNQHPERRLLQQSQQLDQLVERLPRAWAQQRHGLRFQQIHNRWRVPTLPHAALQLQSQRLNAFSPQAVLERGYVRVEGAGGQTVSRRAQALLDQTLTLHFADGTLEVVCRP